MNLHAYFETWSGEPLERLDAYVLGAAEILARYGESEPIWLAMSSKACQM